MAHSVVAGDERRCHQKFKLTHYLFVGVGYFKTAHSDWSGMVIVRPEATTF